MSETTSPGQETPAAASTDEARQSERVWLNIAGLIVFDSVAARGQKAFPCTIANMSAGGAMLRLQPLCDPQKDVLVVDLSKGIVHESIVIWRRPSRCGVKFGRQHSLHRLPEEFKFLEPMTKGK